MDTQLSESSNSNDQMSDAANATDQVLTAGLEFKDVRKVNLPPTATCLDFKDQTQNVDGVPRKAYAMGNVANRRTPSNKHGRALLKRNRGGGSFERLETAQQNLKLSNYLIRLGQQAPYIPSSFKLQPLQTNQKEELVLVLLSTVSMMQTIIRILRLLIVAPLVAIVCSQDTMTIEGRLEYPNRLPYNISTLISVNHGEYTTYSRADGNFTIPNVEPGIYLIDIHSTVHHFSQVKCQFKPDAPAQGKAIFSCLEFVYHGAPKRVMDRLLVLTAMATYDYFEVRKGFSIFSMVKNPMVIMMLVTVVLMYFMPKMMEDLEPEEREKMKRQMELQSNPTKMLGELFGGSKS